VLQSESVDVQQSVDTDHQAVKFADIKGYITTKYDDHWWPGCVMQTFAEHTEVEINFLHPHGPSPSFHYHRTSDLLIISCVDMLTGGLQEMTSTGRPYVLSAHEMPAATIALERQNI
jgi:hypothetical protein